MPDALYEHTRLSKEACDGVLPNTPEHLRQADLGIKDSLFWALTRLAQCTVQLYKQRLHLVLLTSVIE